MDWGVAVLPSTPNLPWVARSNAYIEAFGVAGLLMLSGQGRNGRPELTAVRGLRGYFGCDYALRRRDIRMTVAANRVSEPGSGMVMDERVS